MIHFDRVIANLRHSGLTSAQIARRLKLESERNGRPVKVSKYAVDSWAVCSRTPRDYRLVLHLLDLHMDVCPQRHSVEVIGSP